MQIVNDCPPRMAQAAQNSSPKPSSFTSDTGLLLFAKLNIRAGGSGTGVSGGLSEYRSSIAQRSPADDNESES